MTVFEKVLTNLTFSKKKPRFSEWQLCLQQFDHTADIIKSLLISKKLFQLKKNSTFSLLQIKHKFI